MEGEEEEEREEERKNQIIIRFQYKTLVFHVIHAWTCKRRPIYSQSSIVNI